MFYTISSITPVCHKLHATGHKLVLATGFFDLLHQEHINFLRKAKAVGDILIVAVESDARARALKGKGRPVETQSVRCQNLLALTCKRANVQTCKRVVDYLIALPPDFDNFESYDSLMSAVRPQIYAVSENPSHPKTKNFLVEKYGGKLVVVHDHNPAISTTQIINSKNRL